MKAVKINMNEQKNTKCVKAEIWGVLICIIVIMALTLVLALMMVISGSLFDSAADYLMLIPLAVGGYTGGYTAARINKANGLLCGIICTAVVFIIMLITGFCRQSTDITYMLIIKLAALMLTGAVGGIKGVNKKEKFKSY